MTYQVLDVADPRSVEKAALDLKTEHPKLNCLINNAGVQRRIDFGEDMQSLSSLAEEIDINLKGTVFMTAALLPLITTNEHPTIINISSGLGFVPQAATPIYSATKSAVHSLSLSLRHQLRASKVAVIEVAPPAVRTELDKGATKSAGPKPMEVSDFVAKTIKALSSNRQEIAVGLANMLRIGSRLAPFRFFSLVNG